jgi:hypothetical protein
VKSVPKAIHVVEIPYALLIRFVVLLHFGHLKNRFVDAPAVRFGPDVYSVSTSGRSEPIRIGDEAECAGGMSAKKTSSSRIVKSHITVHLYHL